MRGVLDGIGLPANGAYWRRVLRPLVEESGIGAVKQVAALAGRLALEVRDSMATGHLPVVFGGDHSSAIGTWSGARASLPAGARLGLVWVDAHMDSHTFRTSPSRALHGMPLACLLGRGPSTLVDVAGPGPTLSPEDVCLIGVRSFEQGEARLLDRLGVRIFFMQEVRARGFAAVFHDAWQIANHATAACGISIDLDALDPEEEPGVGSPATGGIHLAELLPALRGIGSSSRLCAIEIAEFNPHADRRDATARAIRELCEVVLA